MSLSIVVLLVVFALIAARKLGNVQIPIWLAMTGGAGAVLAGGAIPPAAALQAIDLDVMVFLFGMFVLGQALVASGYLYLLSYRLFSRARSVDTLVLGILLAGGLSSAVLMNDTLAVVGTPLVLRLAREHRIEPRLLLMALAIAVTTGSVMSPIGNPQNLLIAVRAGLSSPFLSFGAFLAVPTLLSLGLAYVILRRVYRQAFHPVPLVHTPVALKDPALARLARNALLGVLVLIALKVLLVTLGAPLEIRLSYLAIAAAAPILLFSPKRLQVLQGIDWRTLVFFAAMFVLMASVWRSGAPQTLLTDLRLDPTGMPAALGVGLLASQLVSNVPLVALYLPVLLDAGAAPSTLMALAAGSTLAGNLLILGAASNIIIVQGAERHGVGVSFLAFARIGLPLTTLQTAVFLGYLYWLGS
jgi:Na+/H+ antiporter NhaD/arsenite permease-like protein